MPIAPMIRMPSDSIPVKLHNRVEIFIAVNPVLCDVVCRYVVSATVMSCLKRLSVMAALGVIIGNAGIESEEKLYRNSRLDRRLAIFSPDG
ncbi:hypothetical protein GCM10007171_08580 [Dickeya fangzhongdai]|nr:hypothetical protein GCM10007171_08580 [Dickeya fangzhongdai]